MNGTVAGQSGKLTLTTAVKEQSERERSSSSSSFSLLPNLQEPNDHRSFMPIIPVLTRKHFPSPLHFFSVRLVFLLLHFFSSPSIILFLEKKKFSPGLAYIIASTTITWKKIFHSSLINILMLLRNTELPLSIFSSKRIFLSLLVCN